MKTTMRTVLENACKSIPAADFGDVFKMGAYLEQATGKRALVMEDTFPGRFNVVFFHLSKEGGTGGRGKVINNLNHRSGYFFADQPK